MTQKELMKRIICGSLIVLVFTGISILGLSNATRANENKASDRCANCGMMLANFATSRFELTFDDGTKQSADSIKCARALAEKSASKIVITSGKAGGLIEP